ncbi:MAG: hypothetical protein IPG71_14340 [bacterium]|nr:hypothetical protein [bacterium]
MSFSARFSGTTAQTVTIATAKTGGCHRVWRTPTGSANTRWSRRFFFLKASGLRGCVSGRDQLFGTGHSEAPGLDKLDWVINHRMLREMLGEDRSYQLIETVRYIASVIRQDLHFQATD